MKGHTLRGIVLGVALIASISGHAATQNAPATGPNMVTGHVVNIEGETVSVKDMTGHEVQVRVTKETKVEGGLKPKVGDRIQAQVTPDGLATSVALVIPEAAPPAGNKQPVVTPPSP